MAGFLHGFEALKDAKASFNGMEIGENFEISTLAALRMTQGWMKVEGRR